MALTSTNTARKESCHKDSLIIDSILSSSEMDEVQEMLEIESSLHFDPNRFTSMQMGRKALKRQELDVSAIRDRSSRGGESVHSNRFSVLGDEEMLLNYINKDKSSRFGREITRKNNSASMTHATLDGLDRNSEPDRAPDDTLLHDNGERETRQGSGSLTTKGFTDVGPAMKEGTAGEALDGPVLLVPGEKENADELQGMGEAGACLVEPYKAGDLGEKIAGKALTDGEGSEDEGDEQDSPSARTHRCAKGTYRGTQLVFGGI